MPNNVCICGKSHREKPIVITVTACQNRHITRVAPAILSTVSTEQELSPYDKALITIANSTPKLSEPSKSKIISAHTLPSEKLLDTISTELESVFLSTLDSRPELPCNKCLKSIATSTPKLSKSPKSQISAHNLPRDIVVDKTDTSTDIFSDESTIKNESKTASIPEEKCKNVSVNAPSTAALQLPHLIPRYHGPGCALEVCVLEKHDFSCKYKKLENENETRNVLDDKVGSYDVIGRIKYKTCTKETKEKEVPSKQCNCCPADDIPPECLGLPKNDQTVMFAFTNKVRSSNFNWFEYREMQSKFSEKFISNSASKSSYLLRPCTKNIYKENKSQITCPLKEKSEHSRINKSCGDSEVEKLYFHGKSCKSCKECVLAKNISKENRSQVTCQRQNKPKYAEVNSFSRDSEVEQLYFHRKCCKFCNKFVLAKNISKENKSQVTCPLKEKSRYAEVNKFSGNSEVEQLYFHGKSCKSCNKCLLEKNISKENKSQVTCPFANKSKYAEVNNSLENSEVEQSYFHGKSCKSCNKYVLAKNISKENKSQVTYPLTRKFKHAEVNKFSGGSEVEQLHFHGKSCNKCIQCDQSVNRKWYRSLFSYLRRICKKRPKSQNKFKTVSHLK
ncbi:uncharacterized protein LOC126892050 [Diabrotica virgifera virgifera]|uniref:Uncharacterized protein n=1 Tax=Diabrotica virgifera virgifera TaxID=50390 RepID=A0ABM5L4S2_DIAVI|nr:uncharacterized protein LOC126892050 [Diabrotica virgifera virgifera]